MTAPYTPSSSQGMIQTILTLRQIQQQDAAQALARQQFGLAQASTDEAMLGHLGTLASSLPDPTVLLPHVASIAKTTGLDPALLTTIFQNAAPEASVTRNKVIASGVKESGGALDQPAASVALTGALPGGLQADDLNKVLFQGAHQYISSLPPEAQQHFSAGVAQRIATGQTPGEALGDEIFAHLPPEMQTQAVMIGKGLAPNAGEVIQGRLGAGQLAVQSNAAAADAAYRELQGQAALAEANARLKGPQLTQAIDLIKAIQNQQQFMAKNSGTFTPEGQIQQNAALNAMYKELKNIDPDIGGIFTPVDLKGNITAPSITSGIGNLIKQKLNQP